MSLNLLPTIKETFNKYLEYGGNSTQKLKVLHAKIAEDLQSLLGEDYKIKSLGFGDGTEGKIAGRYINKDVDITISKGDEVVAGISVKTVFGNYAQNSNNYFENMLGETANIKCSRKLYFQVLVISEEMPYYKDEGRIHRIETLSDTQMSKYIKLSEDDPDSMCHSPDKTLIMIIKLPKLNLTETGNRTQYKSNYKDANIELSDSMADNFQSSVILNDYDEFMTKIAHRIKAI